MLCTSKMTGWANMLATKFDDLSSISRTHTVKTENSTKLSFDTYTRRYPLPHWVVFYLLVLVCPEEGLAYFHPKGLLRIENLPAASGRTLQILHTVYAYLHLARL